MGFLFRKRKIEGKTAKEWFNLGYKEKDPKKKIEYYSKCLKLDPKNAVAWNNKGLALYDLGRYEEAIRCYDKVLEIDPKNAVAWNNKGNTLNKLGRYEEAIRCYDKALEIYPEYEEAKINKKLAEEKLREQNRKEEMERKTAEEYIEKLIEREDIEGLIGALKNRYAFVRAEAAEALGEIGDKRAVEPLIEALKDSDPDVRWSAALALNEIGDERAVEPLIEALKDSNRCVRAEAAEALGEIGDERAVEPLIEALEDSDPDVRANAAEALEIIASNAIYVVDCLLVQARNLRINTKSEEEKLNEAKRKLDEKKFSNAVKLANECKNSLERKINEYKQISAKQSLDLVYSKIKEAEKLGINVSDAKDLHKKATLKFDNREYEKAIEYAEKSKEIVEEEIRRYNHAKEQIEVSKDIVKSIKKLTSIPKAEELIEKAESALKIGNYNNAVKFAEEAKKIALERKSEYDTAFKSISEAEFAIEKAKEFCYCDTSEAEELLNKARAEFEGGNYAQSISDARKSEEIARKIKEESKPEIEVVLPEKTFKPNYWKTLNLIVRNKGNAHAKAVKIEFSKEVEVKGLKELNINSGEEEKLSIVLKPKEAGDVPLEIKTTYKDADGKEYSAKNPFMLNVTEPVEAKKEEERKRARKAHAFFPAELEHFYSDIEYIGEGGFARVFKAVRIKDGKEVAVKIPISLDPETGRAFTKEIVNWSRLKHENIVELCDMNILPIPYLEMELCDNSLEEVPKPMGVEEATSIIYDVAKGLKHAHSEGIIHQDLKPSNILFKDGKAKITDWGLSKLKAGSKSSSITAFSPLYAAPEHFSKKFGKRDERTDIYQLGVIFYELVTGKLPFEGEDVAEISFSIINEEPTLPSEINPKSKGVEHIIMKCMAKRKEERYQSVDELIEDLAVYLKEEYKKSKDFRKSAFFLYELLLQSVERGDMEAVAWATEGLLNYPKQRYSEKEVQMLKNAVRVLMDIKRNYCNESTKVRDVNRKYNELKDNLFEDFVEEIERDKDLGMVIREMNAELREDEYLDEKHVRNLEYFCVKFVKRWIERFLR